MPAAMFVLIETAVLASSLSADSFTAGFAYGSKKITIPTLSILIITFICCAMTGLSLFFGNLLKPYLPSGLAIGIAFTVLFIIGLIKLLDGITKSIIRRHASLDKAIRFSLFNFKFILRLYADPEAADADTSGCISSGEAAALAASLSLDGVAVGFGAALAGINGWALLGWSFIINIAAIYLGRYAGHMLASKLPWNISWISGVVLIGLAFSRLL
jgi:putative sporulation protein YtaF